jgi:hypothetical protein
LDNSTSWVMLHQSWVSTKLKVGSTKQN